MKVMISTAINHIREWRESTPPLQEISPALRSTDYKCPHWVWEIIETKTYEQEE